MPLVQPLVFQRENLNSRKKTSLKFLDLGRLDENEYQTSNELDKDWFWAVGLLFSRLVGGGWGTYSYLEVGVVLVVVMASAAPVAFAW